MEISRSQQQEILNQTEEITQDFLNSETFVKAIMPKLDFSMFHNFLKNMESINTPKFNVYHVDMNNPRDVDFCNQYIYTRRILISNLFATFSRNLFQYLSQYEINKINKKLNTSLFKNNNSIRYWICSNFGNLNLSDIYTYVSDVINASNITEITMLLSYNFIDNLRYMMHFHKNSTSEAIMEDLNLLINDQYYSELLQDIYAVLNYLGYMAHTCVDLMYPKVKVNQIGTYLFPETHINTDCDYSF